MGKCKGGKRGGKRSLMAFVFVAVLAAGLVVAGDAQAANSCQMVNGQWVCGAQGRPAAPVARIATAPVRGTVRVVRRVTRPVFRVGAGILRIGRRCD